MLSEKFVLTVSRLVMPIGFAVENLVARMLLMWYAFDRFVGVDKAPIMFSQGEVIGVNATFDADGEVPIGCGQGRFGTEHPAISVAKELGIQDNAELLPLLGSLKDGTGSELRLQVLFRSVRRKVNGDPKICIQVMSVFIDAIIMNCKYNLVPCQKELSLGEVFQGLVKRKKFTDKRACTHLQKQIELSLANSKDVAELSHVLMSLFRRRDKTVTTADVPLYKEANILEWMEFVLSAYYQQQIDFGKALEEVRDLERVEVPTRIGERRFKMKLISVSSENDQVAKAARSLGVDIVLHREPMSLRRHISFGLVRGLSSQNLAKMIEWMEVPKKMKSRVKWADLGSFDKSHGITWWHVDRNGNLHNGTKYRPQPQSMIADSSIVDAIQHAFHFEELKFWCNHPNRKIRISARTEGKKQLALPQPNGNNGNGNGHHEVAGINAVATAFDKALESKAAAPVAESGVQTVSTPAPALVADVVRNVKPKRSKKVRV